jgi:O-acetyl-ADP-ribose deacetylase (regulator of RNase III)
MTTLGPHVRYKIAKGSSLELLLGDITEETTDAIVNAANSYLVGGGGVDGAIHRAAGPQLMEECRKVREQRGVLPPGQAVSTPGARLKARHVIHTVGPVWTGGEKNEPQLLESCYTHCMEEAERLGCVSISFPSISTGAFGYPVKPAAQIAVRSVAGFLHRLRSVRLARFVLFDLYSHNTYIEAAQALAIDFPYLQIVRNDPS